MQTFRLICVFFQTDEIQCIIYSKHVLPLDLQKQFSKEFIDGFHHSEPKKVHIVLGLGAVTNNLKIQNTKKLLKTKAIKMGIKRDDFIPIPEFILNQRTKDMIIYLLEKPDQSLRDWHLVRYDPFPDDKPLSNLNEPMIHKDTNKTQKELSFKELEKMYIHSHDNESRLQGREEENMNEIKKPFVSIPKRLESNLEDLQMPALIQQDEVESYGLYDRKIRQLIHKSWIKEGTFEVIDHYLILNERLAYADGDDLLNPMNRLHFDRHIWNMSKRMVNDDWRWESLDVQL